MDDILENYSNYDQLIHSHDELQLPKGEVFLLAKRLFPEFNNLGIYDEIIGDYEIEVYSDARGKGQSVADSAYAAEVSHTVMVSALVGSGLTLPRFVSLIRAEIFAKAKLTVSLLRTIERANSNTEVNAANILLERIDPARFGRNAELPKGKIAKGGVVLNFSVREDEVPD